MTDKEEAISWKERGNILAKQGNYESAISAYNTGLIFDPTNTDILHNKSAILLKLGRNDETQECMRQIQELQNPQAVENKTIINDFGPPIITFPPPLQLLDVEEISPVKGEEEIKNPPKNSNTINNSVNEQFSNEELKKFECLKNEGKSELTLKRNVFAMRAFIAALKIYPNDTETLDLLSNTYYQMGAIDDAIEARNKANSNKLKILKEELLAIDKHIELNFLNYENWKLKLELLKQKRLIQQEDDLFKEFEEAFDIAEKILIINSLKERYFKDFMDTESYSYIENFTFKFGICKFDSDEIQKLLELLTIKELKDINGNNFEDINLCELSQQILEYHIISDIKLKILENHPNDSDECIKNYIELCGENYKDLIPELYSIMNENFNYSGNIIADISRIRKELELKYFEKALVGDTPIHTINDLNNMDGYKFEEFLGKYFTNRGYKVTHTPLSGDQGADLILERLGERIVIQAKNYTGSVGNGAIQEVVASIKHYNAHRGMVITNSSFTISAIKLAESNNVELWDREKLEVMLKKYPF